MNRYNKSVIMKDAWRIYRSSHRNGRSFSECLKASWKWEKSAYKAREEREIKLKQSIAQSNAEYEANKNKPNPYNDLSIPASAYYSGSRGYMGANYVGD